MAACGRNCRNFWRSPGRGPAKIRQKNLEMTAVVPTTATTASRGRLWPVEGGAVASGEGRRPFGLAVRPVASGRPAVRGRGRQAEAEADVSASGRRAARPGGGRRGRRGLRYQAAELRPSAAVPGRNLVLLAGLAELSASCGIARVSEAAEAEGFGLVIAEAAGRGLELRARRAPRAARG